MSGRVESFHPPLGEMVWFILPQILQNKFCFICTYRETITLSKIMDAAKAAHRRQTAVIPWFDRSIGNMYVSEIIVTSKLRLPPRLLLTRR